MRRLTVWVFMAWAWLALGHAQAAAAVPAPATGYRVVVSGPGEPQLALHAEERGHGTPVVLIHGLGGSTYSWRHIAPVLARTHRVIAIDLKGFGRSDKVFDRAYAPRDQARLVARFLIRRGLTDATLVGHSLGGVVALLVADMLRQAEPDRIGRLVLIDVPALPQALSPTVAFMEQPVLPYVLLTAVPSDLLTRLVLSAPTAVPTTRAYSERDIAAYAAPFHDAAARHAYIQTARQIAEPRSRAELVKTYRRLHQRTLLVWCSADDVVPPATGRALARILPNARLDMLPGCIHSPPDEAPAALARSLTRFLAAGTGH